MTTFTPAAGNHTSTSLEFQPLELLAGDLLARAGRAGIRRLLGFRGGLPERFTPGRAGGGTRLWIGRARPVWRNRARAPSRVGGADGGRTVIFVSSF